jgi:hypothetical protein
LAASISMTALSAAARVRYLRATSHASHEPCQQSSGTPRQAGSSNGGGAAMKVVQQWRRPRCAQGHAAHAARSHAAPPLRVLRKVLMPGSIQNAHELAFVCEHGGERTAGMPRGDVTVRSCEKERTSGGGAVGAYIRTRAPSS